MAFQSTLRRPHWTGMSVIALVLASACSSGDGGGTGVGGASGGSGAAAGGNGGTAARAGGDPVSTGGSAARAGGDPVSTGGSAAGAGDPMSTGGTTAGSGGATAGTGGTAGAGGTVGGTAGTTATSCEAPGDFSGPQLRDCDLPGACGACMFEKACASFLFKCAHDADCVCAAECVAVSGVGGTDSCLTQCGLTESPPGFAEWVKGASDMCWDEGCGTIGEPPPEPGSTTGGSTGAGTDPDCVFDTNLSYDPCGEVLQLQSADGSLCARVERRDDGVGSDNNRDWTTIDVRIGPLGQVCHTDDPTSLCSFSSHHNYADWVHITCGGLHYDLNIARNCGPETGNISPMFRLHVFENGPAAGGTCAPTTDGTCPVVAPMELVPVP